ncbi:uncharacterized protein LOC127850097 isoform X1 [Dreissena polymorpha]|uniref:G-protein coupled receptors family 1 profile domain-containing protein n=1 Tax=Dreissena polymorpha TaxID=45954 RepID=A0A9D4D4B2_DREPO|nr:uncharacterized protein LOC127850097 isoform X1 [Dreissena polymorpha]KAH3738763.1 hypothetical protein DPMN_045406 [Dreissena polymorpha]
MEDFVMSGHASISDSFTDIIGQNDTEKLNVTYYNYHNNFPDPPTPTEKILQSIINVLDQYGVPSLLTIGVFSNVFLSITIRNSELKKIAACCYFYASSIVDTLYLIVMAIPWVSMRIVDIYNMEGFCQLVYYLNLLTTFLSTWYVAMLLVERVIICYRPSTAERYFNAFRTKCYITTVSIFAIVGHLYLTWTSAVSYNQIYRTRLCFVIPENSQDIMVMRKIDTVLAFILPVAICVLLIMPLSVFLCASNFKCTDGILRVRTKVITVEVRLNSKKRRQKYTECPSCSTQTDKIQKQRLIMFSQSRRLTLAAVVMAVVFLVLSVPQNIIKSKITFLNGDYIRTPGDVYILKLFEEFYKINFVYKGVIYFTILPEMRTNIVNLVLRICRRANKSKRAQRQDNIIVTTL